MSFSYAYRRSSEGEGSRLWGCIPWGALTSHTPALTSPCIQQLAALGPGPGPLATGEDGSTVGHEGCALGVTGGDFQNWAWGAALRSLGPVGPVTLGPPVWQWEFLSFMSSHHYEVTQPTGALAGVTLCARSASLRVRCTSLAAVPTEPESAAAKATAIPLLLLSLPLLP